MGETHDDHRRTGRFAAYVARPAAATAPAVVVIQEIFGVNQVMRDITDGLAGQGYLAICPDLFWRIEPGIDITDQSEAEWKQAFELFNAFDVEPGVEDIAATIAQRPRGPRLQRQGGRGRAICLGGAAGLPDRHPHRRRRPRRLLRRRHREPRGRGRASWPSRCCCTSPRRTSSCPRRPRR